MFEKGNIIGEEDLLNKYETYQATVTCKSLQGIVGCMKREDFFRL